METNNEHSPLPWHVWSADVCVQGIYAANGDRIVETDSGVYPPESNDAAYIVRCVNAHDKLVEALREISTHCTVKDCDDSGCCKSHKACAVCIARVALAASGETNKEETK